jgi:hypothetical protein
MECIGRWMDLRWGNGWQVLSKGAQRNDRSETSPPSIIREGRLLFVYRNLDVSAGIEVESVATSLNSYPRITFNLRG